MVAVAVVVADADGVVVAVGVVDGVVMTNHLAFDLGLTVTGFAWHGGSDHFTCPAAYRRTPMNDRRQHDRHEWWVDTLRAILLPHRAGSTIIVEAPFIHPKHPTGAMPLMQLHGALRTLAVQDHHDYITVTPAELKKWATGKGNANKRQMIAAARKRGWDGTDHNEADAWLLWTMWAET